MRSIKRGKDIDKALDVIAKHLDISKFSIVDSIEYNYSDCGCFELLAKLNRLLDRYRTDDE